MATIEVDEQTKHALAAQAALLGVSIEDYVRSLSQGMTLSAARRHITAQEFDELLEEGAFEAPPLPSDFSRADVYDEHD